MVKKQIITISAIILVILLVLGVLAFTGNLPIIQQSTIAGTGVNKNQWNPSLESCSTQDDCITFLKSYGINEVLVDWVRCRDTCEFFDGNPNSYKGEIQ